MAIMESKRTGTCNTCRGQIEVGQLIEWDRTNGAKHYKGGCEAKVASEEERKEYQKVLLAALTEWDGIGSFRPPAFGEFIDQKEGRR